MSSPPRILNILVVDDNLDYLEEMNKDGWDSGCKVHPALSLQAAKSLMQQHGRTFWDGVVLDIVCLQEDDQQVPRPDFIHKAIDYFKLQIPDLPRAIMTADDGRWESIQGYLPNERIYHKALTESAVVFDYLRQQTKQRDLHRLALKYSEVFRVFDKGHLPGEQRDRLAHLLQHMHEVEKVRDNLMCCRQVLEAICLALHQNPSWKPIPDADPKKSKYGPSLTDNLHHLTDKGLIAGHRKDYAWLINSTASDHGAHVNELPAPTVLAVQATVYMLLDLIVWLGEMFDSLA